MLMCDVFFTLAWKHNSYFSWATLATRLFYKTNKKEYVIYKYLPCWMQHSWQKLWGKTVQVHHGGYKTQHQERRRNDMDQASGKRIEHKGSWGNWRYRLSFYYLKKRQTWMGLKGRNSWSYLSKNKQRGSAISQGRCRRELHCGWSG